VETILLIEDDKSLRLSMQMALRAEGYRVTVAGSGDEGLAMARSAWPNLVLLDVMLPGLNGFEVCAALRKENAELPILLVTAKGEMEDRVRGLRLGADDYVIKPFGIAELLARVHAALRRQRLQHRKTDRVQVGDLEVDFDAHELRKAGQTQQLTALEMRLLRFFVENEGRLLSRQRILDAVWGADYFGTDRTVDNFINRLRAKIEDDPKDCKLLVTVRGAGYKFSRAVTER
jgi:DNA-binding response OmpR family regulator